MQTLKFSTTINAPKEKVWNILFTDENYPKWAKVFCEGSKVKTNWKEGSPIEFTTPSGEGTFGQIEQNVPNKLMVFRHSGVVKNGNKTHDEESQAWQNIKESYELIETNGKTELKVEIDSIAKYADNFNKIFPKALKRIKELSEL